MSEDRLLRFSGHAYFRQRLVLATLASRPVRIDKIRPDDQEPGIRNFEASFLRLMEKVTNGSAVEINYTGTAVYYKPGIIFGGPVTHDCGTSRGIGYFLEWLVLLAPFAKQELALTLRGITTGTGDMGVDTIRTVTLPILAMFLPLDSVSILASSLELRIVKRGAAPQGGGEVFFRAPLIASLRALNFVECGRIRKIRGIASAVRVSPQMSNRMIDAARSVLNRFIPDLYLFSDVYRGEDSGKSPGFSMSLVATSTTSALHASEATSAPGMTPEDVGLCAARQLLAEIQSGGCVDASHQPFALALMALGPEDVAKCRMGRLTAQAVQCLRDVREALGVVFKIRTIPESEDVLVSCVGVGLRGYRRIT
ncbi:hypothetical protein MVES1_000656 [Malassezia vespertilionis]|uniref:Rcl1p n=1 Tax=Malassezia vespertilionis TaxID=2020962 RepID=A0A2N1JH22_9BASI|nr:uncharacterized protein MVES1_000656 [Malassezia vespertilionis]PKI85843.1 hypothetical protein MVES_000608 [Malassezia vespertilionis]WFD05326.1 hypothetical protein MVES1_000656 [Malassezia vespertilionis]